jgi:hypothetical protein
VARTGGAAGDSRIRRGGAGGRQSAAAVVMG